MRQASLILFIVSLGLHAFGQAHEVNPLTDLLKPKKLKTEGKTEAQKELCKEYTENNQKKIILYPGEGLELSGKDDNSEGMSLLYNCIGHSFATKGRPDTASIYRDQMHDTTKKIRENDKKVEAAMRYGHHEQSTGEERYNTGIFLEDLACFRRG